MSTTNLLTGENNGEVPSVYPKLNANSSTYGTTEEETIRKRSKDFPSLAAFASRSVDVVIPVASTTPTTLTVASETLSPVSSQDGGILTTPLYPTLEDGGKRVSDADGGGRGMTTSNGTTPQALSGKTDSATNTEKRSSFSAFVGHVWDNKTLYVLSVLVGVVFGFALERGKVHEYFFIRNQMSMTNTFVMLKMFLSANIVSTASITFLSYYGTASMKENVRVTGDWMGVYHRGFPALILGCLLLGVGLTVSGSCPGTVFAQIGARSSKAPWSLLGGVIGAVAYGFFDGASVAFQTFHSWGRIDSKYNFLYGRFPRGLTTLIVVAMFATVCALAEYFVPWKTDFLKLFPAAKVSWSYLFHPFLAGGIIGSLQLVLVGLLQQHLGCSGSYCTVVANALYFYKSSPHFNILKARYWQVLMVLGVAFGAFISSSASGVYFASDNMMSWWEAFIGGFVFVFGSRMAAGCTSGHGISGCGHLVLTSFVGVGAMFGGAIATYYIAYY